MNLVGFWSIGTEQWWIKDGWQAALFYRLLGAADIHTRVRLAHTLQAIEQCGLPNKAQILDAGCGEGVGSFWLARRFPNHKIVGVDYEPENIEQACRIAAQANFKNVSFQVADLQYLDLDSRFDLVFSVDVLEHIPDDEKALLNLWQVLKNEGKLLVHVPMHRHHQRRIFASFAYHDVPDHVRLEYTEQEIQTKLQQAGFSVQRLYYTFGCGGELAWEINNLFWLKPILKRFISLAVFPISFALGYWDVMQPRSAGNSFLIEASKQLP